MPINNLVPDQNTLAYLLNDEFQKTTDRFKKTHPAMTINAVMGAANVFIASLHCNAPTKGEALKVLEQNFNIIREVINGTPDAFFTRQNPQLN